ncbi:MAG: hypothetical protein HY257_04100, partial [Chloroflexi bacterium]|nr:hypothetical protein [Chloroflexota bacterium]
MISFRSVALFAMLFVAAIATVIINARPVPPVPKPNAVATWTPLNSYLIDVAGWYEITPNESAVFSPFDLSIEGLKSLPATVGSWRGEPYDMGPAIDQWFENPDLALSNFYRDDRGHQAWLSVFGSRGRKSYVLFE